MRCPLLQAPIVLAHGLFGFNQINVGPWTLAAYFRGIPEFLRAVGNRVLVARVHPTAGIDRRARKLGDRIEAAFGNEPVHIVGHSMGGLDARHLLVDPAWRGRILSLTTIGTPHLGSSLADLAHSRLWRIYRFLETTGWDHGGFHDVRPEAAIEWHDDNPPPDNVPCFSIAGEPPSDSICRPLRLPHRIMSDYEGPNDGLVSTISAEAFGERLPAWPLDHLRQMNWLNGPQHGQPEATIRVVYGEVLENLARQGFTAEEGDMRAAEGVPRASSG